jgi:Ras-related protein Rab-5C
MPKIPNLKLVFLGDTAVGKSSIAQRFVNNQFYEYAEPTIGAAFLTKEIECRGKTIRLDIWDTAGQERYRALAPMYYRGANLALVVYDIASPNSFEGAKTWVIELQEKALPNISIALVANKCDLPDAQKLVSKDQAITFAGDRGIRFFETSAATSYNIPRIFHELLRGSPSPKAMEVNKGRDVCFFEDCGTRKGNSCC